MAFHNDDGGLPRVGERREFFLLRLFVIHVRYVDTQSLYIVLNYGIFSQGFFFVRLVQRLSVLIVKLFRRKVKIPVDVLQLADRHLNPDE